MVNHLIGVVMTTLSPSQMEIYRKKARQRAIKRQKELESRFTHAWEVARQGADMLKRDFGATRVVVFGSLLHPQLFHARSDIDLAGWEIQDYFRAVSRLLDLDPEFEFDLIPMEEAKETIRQVVLAEGIDL